MTPAQLLFAFVVFLWCVVLAGVHACAQVASAKIQLLPDQTLDQVRDLINSHLPTTFRVLDMVRTARSFCAKTSRSKVRYQYMIPSFCFWNYHDLRSILLEMAPLNNTNTNKKRSPGLPLTSMECQQIQQRIKDYRINKDQLESLQQRLHQYTGTHSFHNFTKGTDIMACVCWKLLFHYQHTVSFLFLFETILF